MIEFLKGNLNAVIGLTFGLFGLFYPLLFKGKKSKAIADVTLKIIKSLPTYIAIAEKIGGFNGEDKKRYVMEQINNILENKGLDIDIKQFDDEVEKLVSMSKTVNTSKKGEGVTFK